MFASLLLSAQAMAHDFWVEPDQFFPRVQQPVSFRLYQGQALRGESLPYITDWFTQFTWHDSKGLHEVTAELGDDPAARIVFETQGDAWVVYRSTRDFVEIEPAIFKKYLREEGLDEIEAERERTGRSDQSAREYYSRCAKSYLQVGGAGNKGAFAPYDAGMTLELIALNDPAQLTTGDTLSVRLRYLNKPLANILITAFRRDDPEQKVLLRTNASGEVSVPFAAAGIWLIKAVHMIPAPKELDAEWESFWASLVLQVR
jgi:uncharacterized GH25 family protein